MSQPTRLRSLARGRRLPHAWARRVREPTRLPRPADERRVELRDAPRPLPAERTPTAAMAATARTNAPTGQPADWAVRPHQAIIARPRGLAAVDPVRPAARTVDPQRHAPTEHRRLSAERPARHALLASRSNATRLEALRSRLASAPSTPPPESRRLLGAPVVPPSKALPEARQVRSPQAHEAVGATRSRGALAAGGSTVAARPLPSAPMGSSAVEDDRQWPEVAALPEPTAQAFEDGTLLERTAAAVQAKLMPALLAATTRRVDARLSDLLG